MKKLYYRILRDYTASKILASLIASPQRYDYIAQKVKSGELSNDEATQKNINKSMIMANQLIDSIKSSNKSAERQEKEQTNGR